MTPVGLEEDGVDLGEIDGFGAVSDGFDHGANTEVFDRSQGAFGASCDEVGGGIGEGGVREADAFELVVDVGGEVGGGEGFEFGTVGDPGFEVLIGPELQGGVEEGLADEDEVVVFWEIFEEEAEFAEGFDGDEVGVVYDWNDEFSFGVEVTCFGDEACFAFVIGTVAFKVEGLAKEAQDVAPGVKGSVDDGGDPIFEIMVDEVVFEDGFSGAGFADDEAEAALLGVDFEDVEVTLLMG